MVSPSDPPRRDPLQTTDDEARALARRLIEGATFAALAVLAEGAPVVSRIAFGTTAQGAPLTLVSSLSAHTRALRDDPRASLLVGEPGERGDPLTHPRLTLSVTARFIDAATPQHAASRDRWLAGHPKAKLYIDLTDFRFVVFDVTGGALNGGFGRAYRLSADDLGAGDLRGPVQGAGSPASARSMSAIVSSTP